MLTCQCIANKDDTAILTPCLLHAQWAKGYAVAQLEQRVDRPKLYGPSAGGKAAPR